MKTVRENLLNADRAQALFKERTRNLQSAGAHLNVHDILPDDLCSSDDDGEHSFCSRSSAHSSLFLGLGRASRRGSESSLVNVSLDGASEYVML